MKKKDLKETLNAIEIYCSCRILYDNTSEDDDMIECTKCCEWYHGSCEYITHVKKYKSKDWFCKKYKWFLIKRDLTKETSISIMLWPYETLI